jgi:hypothetical protein
VSAPRGSRVLAAVFVCAGRAGCVNARWAASARARDSPGAWRACGAARKRILRRRRRLVVGIPLRHLLHVLGIAVLGDVVLRVVVLRVRVVVVVVVVVDGRVRLGRHMIVVLLPPSLGLMLLWVHRTSGRAVAAVRAWHHGREAAMLPRAGRRPNRPSANL